MAFSYWTKAGPILAAFILPTSVSCNASVSNEPSMHYQFSTIEPSTNLTWKPCYDGLACSRLQVPLDYADPSLGMTSIAFLKVSGKNATAKSQSVMIIAGGPGGSGVDQLLGYRDSIGSMLGEQYNFVSYDPRGVNNSGPSPTLDCFSGNTEARLAFNDLYDNAVTNTSSNLFQEQYFSASIYGDWCNNAVKTKFPHGYYVTTPAVARDLLTYIEAEAVSLGRAVPAQAKLWAYGGSYGTVVGTTFASMFPDRVGRLILDGVVNADEYYDNNWRQNLESTDETFARFASLCHAAGADRCSFWGPSPADITSRLDAIIERFREQPVALTGLEEQKKNTPPSMVTYSDIKTLLFHTLYDPLTLFPQLADVLHQFETTGNVTGIAGQFASLGATEDSGNIIACADSYRRNKVKTIEQFRDYADYVISKSKYAGDVLPIAFGHLQCRAVAPNLPDSMTFQGPVGAETAFPILFTSNTVDGITPLLSAHTMSSRFPGSVVLKQEAVGHVVVRQGGSACYFAHVQGYLQGIMPPANVTCPQQFVPFLTAI